MSKYLTALKNLLISVFSNNENVGLNSLSRSSSSENSIVFGDKDIKFSDILKR